MCLLERDLLKSHEPVIMTLFGNKALADVIKVRISRQMILDLGWALNPVIDVILRERKGNLRHREKKDM